jgi:trans-2,3-dihydro-3-hydroxyanthranilate isomerase
MRAMKTREGAPLTPVRLSPPTLRDVQAATELEYDVVDVFTGRAFAGNPLAVVHGAGGLASTQLIALARAFGFSETAFPVPLGPGRYALRIATPDVELPFAGHPSIGAAWVLRARGEVVADRVVQECAAGEIGVRHEPDGACWLHGAEPSAHRDVPAAGALGALGLAPSDLLHPAVVAGTGLDFCYLLVRPDAVGRVRPRRAALGAALEQLCARLGSSVAGISVVGWPPGGLAPGAATDVRVLADDIGEQVEDPATGSAALGLHVALWRLGLLADGETPFVLHQGGAVGRPSLLRCLVEVRAGELVSTQVGGHVTFARRGSVAVPAG